MDQASETGATDGLPKVERLEGMWLNDASLLLKLNLVSDHSQRCAVIHVLQ